MKIKPIPHTYNISSQSMSDWLDGSGNINNNYGHILLEEKSAGSRPIAELVKYFQSAVQDVQSVFEEYAGINLNPTSSKRADTSKKYPTYLMDNLRKGVFGEVLIGLLTETYAKHYVGGNNWKIPIFLFRYHKEAKEYFFSLSRNGNSRLGGKGRQGLDFIGVDISNLQQIKLIIGEAKWCTDASKGKVKNLLLGEIQRTFNSQINFLHGLKQFQELLEDLDDAKYSEVILSIDGAMLLNPSKVVPRTNLFMIAGCDSTSKRVPKTGFIDPVLAPSAYSSSEELQTVEVYFEDGVKFINDILSRL